MKSKKTIDTKQNRKDIAAAFDRAFNREIKYPTMSVGFLKHIASQIPDHFDECTVNFAFLLRDKGEDPTGSGFHNYEMCMLPVKTVAMHPDHTQIMFCDDELSEYMITKTASKSAKPVDPNEEEDDQDNSEQ
jgi:hypothetical protein